MQAVPISECSVPGQLARQRLAPLFIASVGMAVPFLLGSSLALGLYPRLGTDDVPFTVFALFMGVASPLFTRKIEPAVLRRPAC